MDAVDLLALPLLPARLAVRALDDIHALAVVATDMHTRADRLESRLDDIMRLGESIEATGDELLRMAHRIDERAASVLTLGERIELRAESVLDLGARIDARGGEIVAEGAQIRAAAVEVTTRAGQILEALPLLERAISMAEPLEGAVERLGRIADRLPGGRAASWPRRPAGEP